MKSKKPCYEGLRILDHVLIVLFKDKLESFKLSMTYSFQHVLAIRCVVEETTALSCAALLLKAHNIAHNHGAYKIFRPNTLKILLACNTVQSSQLMENPR
jgi:hypothetical protein